MREFGPNLVDLKKQAPEDIYNEIKRIYDTFEPGDLNPEFNMSDDLGGGVYLVETLEDLKEIETTSVKDDHNYYSLLETAAAFDVAEWLPEGDHALFVLCNSNAGGPSYFIPKAIAALCPNVEESIKLTKQEWGENAYH